MILAFVDGNFNRSPKPNQQSLKRLQENNVTPICAENIRTKNYQTEEVLSLIRDFEDCTLPVSAWNRETYLTVAYWYLYLNPLAEAEQRMDLRLKRFLFEKGLDTSTTEIIERPNRSNLLRAMNNYIAIHKGQKPFAELADLILDHFANDGFVGATFDQTTFCYQMK